jgi:hypothetical protein
MQYAVWEACVEIGVRPPGCKDNWEDNDVETQALIVAFQQTRESDKMKLMASMAGSGIMV